MTKEVNQIIPLPCDKKEAIKRLEEIKNQYPVDHGQVVKISIQIGEVNGK